MSAAPSKKKRKVAEAKRKSADAAAPSAEERRPESGKSSGEARHGASGGEIASSLSPRAILAVLLAWVIPGGGHFLLGRWGRGLIFTTVIATMLAIGYRLEGALPWFWGGSPILTLKTLGAMGSGAIFFVLRFVLSYEGDIQGAGFEYGGAFLVTAGVMNILLILDTWDIAVGRKE